MDLRLSPRGRIAIRNGRFDIVTNRNELLSQYLRAALTEDLRSDTFPAIRAAELETTAGINRYKLEIQRRVIETLTSSPFGYDFEPENIEVNIRRTGRDSIAVSITSLSDTPGSVFVSYTVDGGRLQLEEETDPPYVTEGEEKLIEQEVVSTEPVFEIEVSCPPTGPLYICEQGATVEVEDVVIDFANIPNTDRIIKKNVRVAGIEYPSLGQKGSFTYTGTELEQSELAIPITGVDGIFLGSVVKNRGPEYKIVNVEPLSGSIRNITFIGDAGDWFIEAYIGQENTPASVRIYGINAVDTAYEYFYSDNKRAIATDTYPFPNEEIRGRKFYKLLNILSPGVYSVYYTGLVRTRYNGSIEDL